MNEQQNIYNDITVKVRDSKKGLLSLAAELAISTKQEQEFCGELYDHLEDVHAKESMIEMFGEDICNDLGNLEIFKK